MSAEEKLKEAAAIGDQMAELLELLMDDKVIAAYCETQRMHAPAEAKEYRERWDNLIGDLQRANLVGPPSGPTDVMEEWGEGATVSTPEIPQ